MTKTFDWERFPNFIESEFTCKCGGGQTHMDAVFLQHLQNLRVQIDMPITITSGYRCPNHPSEKKKLANGKTLGAYTMGKAVDISITNGAISCQMIHFNWEDLLKNIDVRHYFTEHKLFE